MSDATQLPTSTRIIHAVFDYTGQHKTRILVLGVALAFLALVASGFYVVKKEERGVRVRFGKVVTAVVEPGLHYRMPLVERAHVRKVMRIERQLIASQGGDTGSAAFTILSGDTNLLEIDLVVQYRIENLRNYLYASSDPHRLLAMVAREQLVDIVGRNFVDLIFTQNRDYIQRHLTEQTATHLKQYGVGLEVVSLNVVDVRPIAETFAAFRDVNDALAERMQAVSNANRRREQLLARSRGQAEALLLSAKAKAVERIVQARASSAVFSALLGEYRQQPEQVAITRYWQRMRTIFAEAHLAAVNPDAESTIDINMLDGIATYPPTALPPDAMAAAVPDDTADRPLLTTLRPPGMHTIETVDADQPLLDGQFHEPLTERDHGAAHPRSLLFDTPSIFRHRHVVRRRVPAAAPTPTEMPSAAVEPADQVKDDAAAAPAAAAPAAEPAPTDPTATQETKEQQPSAELQPTTDKGDYGTSE